MSKWWERFGDPVLSQLFAAAQKESVSIATAKAQVEESRANLIGSDSVFLPNIDSSLSSSRSNFSFSDTPFLRNQHQLSVQSSLEIDLFGGLARQEEASSSQLESRNASWHDARVEVAAELGVKELEQEKVSAWIALYRSVGDSWEDRQTQNFKSTKQELPDKNDENSSPLFFQYPSILSREKS